MDTAPPGSRSAAPKLECTTQSRPKICWELTPSPGAFPTLSVEGALAQAKAHPSQIWVGNHQSEQFRAILLTAAKASSQTPSPQVPTEQAGQLKNPKTGPIYPENRSKTSSAPPSSQTIPAFCCLEENSPL